MGLGEITEMHARTNYLLTMCVVSRKETFSAYINYGCRDNTDASDLNLSSVKNPFTVSLLY